jgi:hypothetical protein
MPLPEQRAADSDREAAAERLREAAGDGRLVHDELEERLQAALSARTYGELEAVTADLPERAAQPPGRRLALWQSEEVRARMATFVIANVICITVWLATGAEGTFWPKWVLLGTGIALFVTLVHHVFGIEEEGDDRALPPGSPRQER